MGVVVSEVKFNFLNRFRPASKNLRMREISRIIAGDVSFQPSLVVVQRKRDFPLIYTR